MALKGNRWAPKGLCKAISALFAIFALALLLAAPAGAAVGQLSNWGSFGFGNGQFSDPLMLGVDSTDGSVYVGDLTQQNATTEDREFVRIQKLSSTGTFQASVELPRYLDPPPATPENEKPISYWGIAVDPALGRFYVLEAQKEAESKGTFYAKRILVFSTTPVAGKLVAPEGGPSSLPIPFSGLEGACAGEAGKTANCLPRGIAVDPSNHDLVIMGEVEEPSRVYFQRISSSGVAGAHFYDTANTLKAAGRIARSFAVGPNGVTYAVSGVNTTAGKTATRGFELSPDFSTLKEIPGFKTAAEAEEWPFGLETLAPAVGGGGQQIAISPDGDTLYWKERLGQEVQENFLVHGFSLIGKATSFVYGGGTAEKCRIQSARAGLATIGEKVVVADYGPPVNESVGESPPYGDKIRTYGPGGTDCPVPVAKFKVNGVEGDVKVKAGDTVNFDASGSVLTSGPASTPGFKRELIWKFGDGSEEVVKGAGAGEAPTTTSHVYASGGTYKAILQIRLKTPSYGNPALVEHGVEVENDAPAEYELKVSKNGSGTGTVTSNPAGIDCGPDCAEKYLENTVVTLTGSPDAGSKAVVWQDCPGTVNGSNQCVVTMDAAKEAIAVFSNQAFNSLTVSKNGTGAGTVSSAPAGINCDPDCSEDYTVGTVVTLTGTPDAGSKAVVWQDCPGTVNGSNQCVLTLDDAKEAKATFDREQRSLKVTKDGSGTGTVSSAPAAIDCGSICEANLDLGTVVTLTGTPDAGSKAVVWQDCPGTVNGSNQCVVTMSAAKEAKATFDLVPVEFELKVSKNGTGTGTVASAPAAIDCGTTCEASLELDTAVTLTGTPDAGSNPVVWQICPGTVNGSNECVVTMDAAKEAKATFARDDRLLRVTKTSTGAGFVASAPAGIGCGGTCAARFALGQTVMLTGVSGANTDPVSWSGCDAIISGNRCEVTVDADTEIAAAFNPVSTGITEPSEPTDEGQTGKKKLTPRQKALRHCKKLKGRKKQRCVRRANRIGRSSKNQSDRPQWRRP